MHLPLIEQRDEFKMGKSSNALNSQRHLPEWRQFLGSTAFSLLLSAAGFFHFPKENL